MKLATFYLTVAVLYETHTTTVMKTYRAAVIEFTPDDRVPLKETRIYNNLRSYMYFIEEAAKKYVDIIVFPESGLTGYGNVTHENIDELSTTVPEASLKICPCQNRDPKFAKFLIDLSCAAAKNRIYIVCNLAEKSTNSYTKEIVYHNTNVVFDRNGIVVARYRKINFFIEPAYTAGTEVITFETDFGVKFGIFTCADILYKKPALDVVANVSNIIMPTAWFSDVPSVPAFSVQYGYVRSTGINLLVAGYNNPSRTNGGSAIYFHNGKIAKAYISGLRNSKMLIEDVPIITTPTPICECKEHVENCGTDINLPELTKESSLYIDLFRTNQEDLTNYTKETLDMEEDDFISKTICNGNFCCSFDISIERKYGIPLNYAYKLMAYYGVLKVETNRTYAVSNCLLSACLNETDSTCGQRHKEGPRGIVFNSISVKGVFNLNNTHVQPNSITHKLLPITGFTFCKKQNKKRLEAQIKTNRKYTSILSFGLFGRNYAFDGRPPGPIRA